MSKVRYAVVVFLISFCFLVSGCAKVVDTRYKQDDVKIIDSYHRDSYISTYFINGHMRLQPHSEQNEITVEYMGEEFTLYEESYYDVFHNRIGDIVKGRIEIKYYDDGTFSYNVIDLCIE